MYNTQFIHIWYNMGTEVYKMGRKPIEMIGVKFGRWTVIERAGSDKDSKPMWLCECVCGNRKIINGAALRRGDSKSCGCISKEIFTKHGMYKSRLNKTYRGMKQRCYNPKNTRYEYYGGRGIVMCQEWLGENGFINFMNWALKSGYTDELSIDRINNDGIYEPSNCQWVNEESQCRNRRIKSNNKTGVSGVFPRGSKWRVHIRVNGKNLNVGTFDNFDDASLARKNAEAKYWGGGDNNDRNVK